MQLSPSNYRNGLNVQAKTTSGATYTKLILDDGKWMLTGNYRYADCLAERAQSIVCGDGAVEDFDLIANQPIYVRLGGLPEGGRSRNFRDGGFEDGVSAFRAAWDGKTLVVEANAGAILFDSNRPLYQIEGDVLGQTGSDDEPLLANAVQVKKLNRSRMRFAR